MMARAVWYFGRGAPTLHVLPNRGFWEAAPHIERSNSLIVGFVFAGLGPVR
jgi:hypothetical protein